MKNRYANIVSTLALVISLTAGGAYAAGKINGKTLKNNSVTAKKVKFPRARALTGGVRAASVAEPVSPTPAPLAALGSYPKVDPTSVLDVNWSGVVRAENTPCIFQVRVDGDPPDGNGGQVFVPAQTTMSIATSGLFSGLPAGDHLVTVWSRQAGDNPFSTPPVCEVDARPDVPSTATAVEVLR